MNFAFTRKLIHELRHGLLDYIVLSFCAIATLFLLVKSSPHRVMQLMILGMFGVIYVFWAALHHVREKTFHAKIMLEYVLIVASVLIMLFFLY